jgi:hypothetical protein
MIYEIIKKAIKFFSYPIRYLLRNKVKSYRVLLEEELELQRTTYPKLRQSGASYRIEAMLQRRMLLIMKYDKFIKKWSL